MQEKTLDLEQVKDFISQQKLNTKIYIGADSERFIVDNIWYAKYTVAIVVHINGNRGCKIFGEISNELDYDQKQSRPTLRLMNEVYKASDMYNRLRALDISNPMQVHLDINPDEREGSNCVIGQAIGYIRGTCNITPQVKPQAFAATCAADRFATFA